MALMGSARAGEEPEHVITRLARDSVADAMACGWSGPPFDPEALSSFRGLKVEPAHWDIRADARVFPGPDGKLRIEYDPKKPRARVNFSICHELTHTFFPDCYETVRHRRKTGASRGQDFELELLCDLGAAELLMPAQTFATDLVEFGTSLEAVKALRSRYVASSEAVLIRLAQMSPSPCAVVFLSEKLKPTEERAAATQEFNLGLPPVPAKLRVDYVRPSASFPIFIPQDKSVPGASSAYKCLLTEDIASGIERWDINGFGNWSVQAARLPRFEDGAQRVAALVLVQT
jgi:hypothetical protein